jgi:hypothetical protein
VSGVKAVRDDLVWIDPVSGMTVGPDAQGTKRDLH